MYKVRVIQSGNEKAPKIMWILSPKFTKDIHFINEKLYHEVGTYAGNDAGWGPLIIWSEYL